MGNESQTGAMPTLATDERSVLEHGIARLAELLGGGFEISPLRAGMLEDGGRDAVYTVRAVDTPGARWAQVVIAAKTSLTPAAAREILDSQLRLLRQLYDEATVLVIAPWLSPRTRNVLRDRRISYLDLTGNIDLRLPTGIVILTQGAQHDPAPQEDRKSRGLAGASAGALARVLVDHQPPYRQRTVAEVAQVSHGYLSRVLRTLDDEALITRDGAVITDVKWAELLRTRAASIDLMKINHVTPMVARKGAEHVNRQLISQGSDAEIAVTGSYAARELAPSAVGGPLMLYVQAGAHTVDEAADELSLMPATSGGVNVWLLKPPNRTPFRGLRDFGATKHVAHSQLVLDCLSGPGRLPAEGEAVLEFMIRTEHDGVWRRPPGALTEDTERLG